MKILFLCISFLFTANGYSQTDSLPQQMARYAACKNPDLLFVHIDKHIYTNNEFIWFSAWLLRHGQDSLPLHRFLSVVLVPADTRIPAVQQKFLMANGFSCGSVQLPDSIAPGEYKLVAYTNVTGRDSLPLAVFTQDLSIRFLRQSPFVAAATILDDAAGKKDLLVTVRDKITYQPIRDAAVLLWCGNSKLITAKTDKNGIVRQNLAEIKPAGTAMAVITAKVKYKSDVEYLQTKWPGALAERQLDIRFYPESGYLLSNIPGRIGWESKTDQGEPVPIRAVVLENNKPVDTIKTDERGLGTFTLAPKAGASYTMQPIAWPKEIRLKNEGYALQRVLSKGTTISIPKAIAGDSLLFKVYAAGYSQVNMIIHDFRTVFEQQTLQAKKGEVKVLLMLDKIPKGLVAITLLDSNNHPLAERIFFAHYGSNAVCTITPSQPVYEKRQKVTLTFQLTSNQQPAEGYASVSCAQANRFDNSKQQDIESFGLLNDELQNIPVYRTGQGFRDTAYLENVLLVRGWRRYTWQELLAENYPSPVLYSPVIEGHVVPFTGKIRKPLTVNLFGGQTPISFIKTDAKGYFQFTEEQLLVPAGKKLFLLAGDKIEKNTVVIRDPYLDINKKIADSIHFNPPDADKYLQFAQDMTLDDLKKVKQLAVVTVTQHRNTVLYGASNACGDYICMYGFLNCPKHFGDMNNRIPQKGMLYNLRGGGTAIYQGCDMDGDNQEFGGISTGKEFYVEDYSENSSNPKFISTLYWSPVLVFDKNGKAEASFYTSDIAGRFRIVMNGMAGANLFYSTASFDVK